MGGASTTASWEPLYTSPSKDQEWFMKKDLWIYLVLEIVVYEIAAF